MFFESKDTVQLAMLLMTLKVQNLTSCCDVLLPPYSLARLLKDNKRRWEKSLQGARQSLNQPLGCALNTQC